MLVTNTTNNDYWFGPMHLAAGVGQTLTVDDTSDTSLYLSNDAIADQLNNVYLAGNITVSSAAGPFPRPTGTPTLFHGDGSPEGMLYAPPGSLYMRRDNTGAPSALYSKTTGIQFNTGWQALSSSTPALSGWTAFAATLSYSSTDGHTFVCTTSSDLSGTIPLGARIELTHASTTKYFIVTAITAGSITLYGGTSYSLSGSAITGTYYSVAKAPFGFPLNPASWTETLSDTSSRTQASAANNTWYNPGGLTLAVPIGIWNIECEWTAYSNVNNDVKNTFSTTNSSESDPDFTTYYCTYGPSSSQFRRKTLALTSKTSYYVNVMSPTSGGSSTIGIRGDQATTIIRAVCAYL